MVITFSSLKGGVGKSTDAIMLANCLAARGKSVLVIDLDSCNNSVSSFYTMGIEGVTELYLEKNIFKALTDRDIKSNIIPSNRAGISVVFSSVKLPDIRTIDIHVLKKIIHEVYDDFDFIVIDTSPTYDNHTISALYAADIIFTPFILTSFDFTTTKFLNEKILDELPEQYEKWYLLYSRWLSQWENIENSTQAEYARLFESTFSNVLDGAKIPDSRAAYNYTQLGEKLNINCKKTIGNKRLAIAFNQLASTLLQLDPTDTSFYAEEF